MDMVCNARREGIHNPTLTVIRFPVRFFGARRRFMRSCARCNRTTCDWKERDQINLGIGPTWGSDQLGDGII